MGGIAGSLRKVIIGGTTFDVMLEGGFSGPGSNVENTSIATTGGNIRKMMGRTRMIEGIMLICSLEEAEELGDTSESNVSIDMSVENAEGDTYRATGWIEFESYESEDAKATVKLIPQDKWTLFAT